MIKKFLVGLAIVATLLGFTAAPAAAADASCGTAPNACYYWATGSIAPTTAKTGFYVGADVYQPTLNTTTDYHSLFEIVVTDPHNDSVELGWTVDTAGASPKLFAAYWHGGSFAGYNVGITPVTVNGSSGCSGSPVSALSPGSTITGTFPLLAKQFGVARGNLAWPNGAWFLAFDGAWVGCIRDSTTSAAGAVSFGSATYFAAFGEVASKLDAGLGAGHKPCTQMGSGVDPAVATTGAARVGNAKWDDGTAATPLSLHMGASAGTVPSYYNIAALGTAGTGFYYGGAPHTASSPPCS